MWPGQTGCDAMTAVLSMETHALDFEYMCWVCVRVVCVFVCVGVPSLFICPQKGDRELWWCALQKVSTRTTNKWPQTVSLSLADFFLDFFLLLCNLIQEWKAFFFFSFTAPWHPESFSFCSLGEAANALDETLKSLSFHLILWQVNLISLPSCLKCIFGKKCVLKIKAVLMQSKNMDFLGFFCPVDGLNMWERQSCWRGFGVCSSQGKALGLSLPEKGVFDWRELDMLKLNKPISQAKS